MKNRQDNTDNDNNNKNSPEYHQNGHRLLQILIFKHLKTLSNSKQNQPWCHQYKLGTTGFQKPLMNWWGGSQPVDARRVDVKVAVASSRRSAHVAAAGCHRYPAQHEVVLSLPAIEDIARHE